MGLFRRLFGSKKSSSSPPEKEKRRWSFARSSNTIPSHTNLSASFDDNFDANRHAIAVAAATAAVAEAALAAAQAAAEVVRLTSGGGGRITSTATARTASGHISGSHRRWAEVAAAVQIQSAFRGYLARRALRALKALVKLQALVRGHIVRKQTADMLRRMQTLVRVQARARATRSHIPESWHSTATNSSLPHYDTVLALPHKEYRLREYSTKVDGSSILKKCGSNSNFRDTMHLDEAKLGSNWLEHWMEQSFRNNHATLPMRKRHADDERSDKILEVDTWMPRMKSQQSTGIFQMPEHILASDNSNQRFTAFQSPSKLSAKATNHMPTVSSEEFSSLSSLKFPVGKDEAVSRTVENSPHVCSPLSRSRAGSSGRRSTFTPTRSECSWGFFNGFSGYPSYMANTESFRNKLRSQSAPRQRLELEKFGSSKRPVQGFYEADTISESGFAPQTNFRNKAYPATGRMNSRPGSNGLR